jgi:hypothetical protein
MVQPLTVWKVELSGGNVHEDIEGTLTLDEDALAFEPAEAGPALQIAYGSIEGVKRLRMSPVLLITRRTHDRTVATAFYLAKPPPLISTKPTTPTSDEIAASPRGRPRTRWFQRRRNSYYLTAAGVETKPILAEWVNEVRARLRDA